MENNLTDLFNELFPEDSDKEDAAEYSFVSESDVDDSIENIKSLDIDIKRFKDLYAEKVEKLKGELEGRVSKLNNKREWILFNLKNSVMAAGDAKESKTMFKKSFLSGDVIIKKSVTKLIKPDLSEETILKDFTLYKKSDTKITLDWAEMKKSLKILNGLVIDTSTGENLSDTIMTEITPETVTIK